LAEKLKQKIQEAIMLKSEIEGALNQQVNNEMSAAHEYLAMTAYCERINLRGFAHWMRVQHQEELSHGERLVQYISDRGGRVELEAIKKPRGDFESIQELFNHALEMEKQNTQSIHQLFELATQLSDYATQSQLKWFIDEQVEEESSFNEIRSLLEIAGDDKAALLILNKNLGERTSE